MIRCEVLCLFCLLAAPSWKPDSKKPWNSPFSAHPVDLHNVLVRPSGLNDNNKHFHHHGSVSPSHLFPPSSLLSITFSHLSSCPFFLSHCLSAVFKWIPLQKLVSGRSSAASTDPLRLFIFFFLLLLFFLSLFPCFYSICCAPSTAMAEATHMPTDTCTHILKMTYTKPIVAQPSEWLAGKEKCSVIPSPQIHSLEMQCQPESPKGCRGFLRNSDNHTS